MNSFCANVNHGYQAQQDGDRHVALVPEAFLSSTQHSDGEQIEAKRKHAREQIRGGASDVDVKSGHIIMAKGTPPQLQGSNGSPPKPRQNEPHFYSAF